MRVKYVVAVVLVAMIAVPGTASQLAARSAMSAPLIAPVVGVSTSGLFNDPDANPRLSITLPSHFVALEAGSHPLATFQG